MQKDTMSLCGSYGAHFPAFGATHSFQLRLFFMALSWEQRTTTEAIHLTRKPPRAKVCDRH
jgi:hypothetical protein